MRAAERREPLSRRAKSCAKQVASCKGRSELDKQHTSICILSASDELCVCFRIGCEKVVFVRLEVEALQQSRRRWLVFPQLVERMRRANGVDQSRLGVRLLAAPKVHSNVLFRRGPVLSHRPHMSRGLPRLAKVLSAKINLNW